MLLIYVRLLFCLKSGFQWIYYCLPLKGTSSCGVSLFGSGFIWTSKRDLKDILKSLGLFEFIVI